jgi:hypothetical protein
MSMRDKMIKFGKSGSDLIFTINGFEYRIYRDVQDDCIKNYHLAFFGDNELDIPAITNTSPYEELDTDTFYCHIMDALYEAQNVGCEFDL